jgi:hypothetical protein
MVRYAVIALILITALTIYSVIDVSITPEDKVRSLPKWAWLIVILFVPGIGAVAWIIAGKPKRPGKGGRWIRKIIPPDDNPDFLGKL